MIYIESPFQLLQAYELRKIYNCNYEIIIRLNNKKKNDEQLKKMVSELAIENVIFLQIFNLKNKIKNYTKLIRKFFFVKKLVIGDSNSFLFKLVSIIFPNKNILLLDDGVSTLNDKINSEKYKRFSIFINNEDDCFKNNFFNIKKLCARDSSCGYCELIIGTKAVEEEIIQKEDYKKLLIKMVKNSNENVVYIPHRGEDKKNLEEYSEEIKFKIYENQLPIELISLELNMTPKKIHNLFSTSVYSLPLIYECVEIINYKFDYEILKKRKSNIIRICENIYKKFGEANDF